MGSASLRRQYQIRAVRPDVRLFSARVSADERINDLLQQFHEEDVELVEEEEEEVNIGALQAQVEERLRRQELGQT